MVAFFCVIRRRRRHWISDELLIIVDPSLEDVILSPRSGHALWILIASVSEGHNAV
jgi:hypothetical protein